MPPRAGNVSMNSDKLVKLLGAMPFAPWPIGENLFPTDRRWHFLQPRQKSGSFQFLKERLYSYPCGA